MKIIPRPRFSRRGGILNALVLMAAVIGSAFLPVGRELRAIPVEAAQPTQTARTCMNIQLHVQAQSSQGAAGTIGIIYRMHNLFGGACTLYGYPGVQLLDRNFLSLPTEVHRGGGPVGSVPRRVVRLAGHGDAYFAMFYSDVPHAGQPPCATAHYVMITAPNNFLPVVTYAFSRGGSIMECSGNVYVSPVTARPTY